MATILGALAGHRGGLKAGPARPLSCYDCGHCDLPIAPSPFGDKFGTIDSKECPQMPGNSGEMNVAETSGKSVGKPDFSALDRARRISVAPMMDWSDGKESRSRSSDLGREKKACLLFVATLSRISLEQGGGLSGGIDETRSEGS